MEEGDSSGNFSSAARAFTAKKNKKASGSLSDRTGRPNGAYTTCADDADDSDDAWADGAYQHRQETRLRADA
jgi:hypothetical protein